MNVEINFATVKMNECEFLFSYNITVYNDGVVYCVETSDVKLDGYKSLGNYCISRTAKHFNMEPDDVKNIQMRQLYISDICQPYFPWANKTNL